MAALVLILVLAIILVVCMKRKKKQQPYYMDYRDHGRPYRGNIMLLFICMHLKKSNLVKEKIKIYNYLKCKYLINC